MTSSLTAALPSPSGAPPTVPSVALPDLSHLRSADYARVYEPSDDTYLLCDALSADAAEIRRRRPAVCVEVGSGSGCVIAHLGSLLPRGSAALLATDVNPHAAAATVATGAANGQPVAAARMDLLGALRPGSVDVLVFNPPYVPTSADELAEAEAGRDIAAAWAGGPRGRVVLDRLLPTLGEALSPRGVFYLLGVAENAPDEIARALREAHGLVCTTVAARRAQNERLFVMRCARPWEEEAARDDARERADLWGVGAHAADACEQCDGMVPAGQQCRRSPAAPAVRETSLRLPLGVGDQKCDG